MSISSQTGSSEDSLEQLYQDLEAGSLDALWRREGDILTPEPRGTGQPHLWKWKQIEPLLHRAGRLVEPGRGGERRVIRLVNPSLEPPSGSTHTLSTTFQFLLPGETAPVHRHTPYAIRFIVSGHGAYTEVEGEQIEMEPGDLITTPSWTWHGHGNPTDEPVIWIDAIDTPLVLRLKTMFFEPGKNRELDFAKSPGSARSRAGKSLMTRANVQQKDKSQYSETLPVIYRWKDIEPVLREEGAERSPFDGDLLYYSNPFTRDHNTLPTIGCSIQRLFPREQTQAHRHLSSTVYHVFSGQGESEIEGKRYSWREGDTFAIPTWAWHSHKAADQEEAILFSLTDRPVMEALQWYREETPI